VKLQIGFNRRFDANFREVHELVASGKIGAVHMLHIVSRDPAPPPLEYVKVSGGIFLDMTIHDFDMARYLIGSEVSEVYTLGAVCIDPAIGAAGDVDTAVTLLRFESGVIATIDNSRGAVYGYDQRVEVFGSGGSMTVSNETPHRAVVSDTAFVHLKDRYPLVVDALALREAGVEPERAAQQAGPWSGQTWVLTGTLDSMTRPEAEERIRSLGANPSSAVSAKTHTVVAGPAAGSGKVHEGEQAEVVARALA